jgi:hypothetical protein
MYLEKGEIRIQTHAEGWPREEDALIRGCYRPKVTSKPPEVWRHQEWTLLHSLGMNQPADTSVSDFWPPEV